MLTSLLTSLAWFKTSANLKIVSPMLVRSAEERVQRTIAAAEVSGVNYESIMKANIVP